MIRPLILALALASPASAATVLHETWGDPARGTMRYGVTVDAVQEAQDDGSTIVARFSFDNCWCRGSGHSRVFGWSLTDQGTSISGSLGVITTLNAPDDADWWAVSAVLPTGYRWGGADGWVDELASGERWIIRDAPVDPPIPAPVPLPAAGGLLLAGLVALWMRRGGGMSDNSSHWAWWAGKSTDDYALVGPCRTRDEAIAEAVDHGFGEWLDEAEDPPVWKHTFVVFEAEHAPLRLADWIRADQIIEMADEDLADSERVSSEYDDGPWFRATPEQKSELARDLRAACDEWQRRNGLVFTCCTFNAQRGEEAVTVVPTRLSATEEAHKSGDEEGR